MNQNIKNCFDAELNKGISLESIKAYDSKNKYFWKCCKCGEVFQASPYKVYKRPLCKNCKLSLKYKGRSLADTKPDEVEYWHPTKNGKLTPYMLTEHSSIEVWWKCPKCRNEWKSSPQKKCRASTKSKGCKSCRVRIPGDGESFAEKAPDLLKYWDYEKNVLQPNEVKAHSSILIYFKCPDCGKEWTCSASNMYMHKLHNSKFYCSRCRALSNSKRVYKIKPGNALSEKFPSIAAEWDAEKNGSLKPESISYGSKKEVWWKCSKCGHSWKSNVNRRTYKLNHSGLCPNCKGKGTEAQK